MNNGDYSILLRIFAKNIHTNRSMERLETAAPGLATTLASWGAASTFAARHPDDLLPDCCCDESPALEVPTDTPEKVALAKMRSLIKRGLVDGCPCGCRGDFELPRKAVAR